MEVREKTLKELNNLLYFRFIETVRENDVVSFIFEKHMIKYSLKLYSQWRITKRNKIKIAISDIFCQNTLLGNKYIEDFNWNEQGANLYDEKINDLLKEELIVEKVEADNFAGFKIYFKNGYILENFICTSENIRVWEICQINKRDYKFIVEGNKNISIEKG